MDPFFAVETLSSQTKTFSLTSKPQVAIKADPFETILARKETEQLGSIKDLQLAAAAMERAEEAFTKMAEVRSQIEAAYQRLLD